MRQKYVISRSGADKILKIREYAITDKNLNRVPSSLLKKGDFQFLCEETYDSDRVMNSITRGRNDVIATLRTRNIFPIQSYAAKLAESVIELYKLPEDSTVELFFDDTDLVSH